MNAAGWRFVSVGRSKWVGLTNAEPIETSLA